MRKLFQEMPLLLPVPQTYVQQLLDDCLWSYDNNQKIMLAKYTLVFKCANSHYTFFLTMVHIFWFVRKTVAS